MSWWITVLIVLLSGGGFVWVMWTIQRDKLALWGDEPPEDNK